MSRAVYSSQPISGYTGHIPGAKWQVGHRYIPPVKEIEVYLPDDCIFYLYSSPSPTKNIFVRNAESVVYLLVNYSVQHVESKKTLSEEYKTFQYKLWQYKYHRYIAPMKDIEVYLPDDCIFYFYSSPSPTKNIFVRNAESVVYLLVNYSVQHVESKKTLSEEYKTFQYKLWQYKYHRYIAPMKDIERAEANNGSTHGDVSHEAPLNQSQRVGFSQGAGGLNQSMSLDGSASQQMLQVNPNLPYPPALQYRMENGAMVNPEYQNGSMGYQNGYQAHDGRMDHSPNASTLPPGSSAMSIGYDINGIPIRYMTQGAQYLSNQQPESRSPRPPIPRPDSKRSKSVPRRPPIQPQPEKDPFDGIEGGWWSKGEVQRNKERREMADRGRSIVGGNWESPKYAANDASQSDTRRKVWEPSEEDDFIPAAGYSGHIQGLRHLGIGKSFNSAAKQAKQEYVQRRRARSGSRDNFYSSVNSSGMETTPSEVLNYANPIAHQPFRQ